MNKILSTALMVSFSIGTFENSVASERPVEFKAYEAWNHNDQGCLADGHYHEVGTILQMNKEALSAFKTRTGHIASDGYAVLMQCTYLVDSEADDHPRPSERRYVWVGFSW
jgi:hypothetical protein